MSRKTAQPRGEARGADCFPCVSAPFNSIDGSANFADYSIEPSFATGILGLNGPSPGCRRVPRRAPK